MTSSELDWTVSQSYELDSTEGTTEEEEEDSTEGTTEEVRMGADSTDETSSGWVRTDADSTDGTSDKFLDADSTGETTTDWANPAGRQATSKIPSSEILIRTIAVERTAPLAALPADADAAYSQWLSGSGLAPSKH